MPMQTWKSSLRPNRSPSLPASAVAMVSAEVCGDHPRDVRCAAEIADDGRQRRTDDGLIQGGEEHAHRDDREDDVATGVSELHAPTLPKIG
jgi:hypothetical protein